MGGDCNDPPPGWSARPQKPADPQAHTGINKRLTQQLKIYGLEDPPVRQEKATPPGIVHSIVAKAATSSDTRSHHIANLVTIGFYFCLRSCKYMKCTGHRRTVQFRPLMDLVLFVRNFLLDTRLHPGLDPGVGFSLEYECSVTQ